VVAEGRLSSRLREPSVPEPDDGEHVDEHVTKKKKKSSKMRSANCQLSTGHHIGLSCWCWSQVGPSLLRTGGQLTEVPPTLPLYIDTRLC
jgi:hypothetical protein